MPSAEHLFSSAKLGCCWPHKCQTIIEIVQIEVPNFIPNMLLPRFRPCFVLWWMPFPSLDPKRQHSNLKNVLTELKGTEVKVYKVGVLNTSFFIGHYSVILEATLALFILGCLQTLSFINYLL